MTKNTSGTWNFSKKDLMLYFADLWIELFDFGTPAFYRVKSSNVHTLLREMEAYLFLDEEDLFLKKEDLFDLMDEFFYLYDLDNSLTWFDKQRFQTFIAFLKEIRTKKDIETDLSFLKIRIRPVLAWFDDHYFNKLKTKIQAILCITQPSSEHFRTVKKLTCAFATEITQRWFSKPYSYNVFYCLKTKIDTELMPINELMKSFELENGEFEVYFKFWLSWNHANKYVIDSCFGWSAFQVVEKVPFTPKDVITHKINVTKKVEKFFITEIPPHVNHSFAYIKCVVNAFDADAAVKKFHSELAARLDIFSYEYHTTYISLPNLAIVRSRLWEVTAHPTTEQLQWYKRPSSLVKLRELIEAYNKIKDDPYIDKQVVKKLETLLEFHRHYLSSETLEHKFINLWIALEYVFSMPVKNAKQKLE